MTAPAFQKHGFFRKAGAVMMRLMAGAVANTSAHENPVYSYLMTFYQPLLFKKGLSGRLRQM